MAARGKKTVFPTPVGVFLRPPRRTSPAGRSSPRPWGCFYVAMPSRRPRRVFPTPVGVFPLCPIRIFYLPRLPHARGGVSIHFRSDAPPVPSSPRPWGCFSKRELLNFLTMVFPTPVGVFPAQKALRFPAGRLPHARGGVSTYSSKTNQELASSPRPWGCFPCLSPHLKS